MDVVSDIIWKYDFAFTCTSTQLKLLNASSPLQLHSSAVRLMASHYGRTSENKICLQGSTENHNIILIDLHVYVTCIRLLLLSVLFSSCTSMKIYLSFEKVNKLSRFILHCTPGWHTAVCLCLHNAGWDSRWSADSGSTVLSFYNPGVYI